MKSRQILSAFLSYNLFLIDIYIFYSTILYLSLIFVEVKKLE